jgi:hypothetical protein
LAASITGFRCRSSVHAPTGRFVLLWLLFATVAYLQCWLLVPEEEYALRDIDIDEHFVRNRRQFLGAWLFGSLLAMVTNFNTPTMVTANWFTVAGFFISAVAWWSPKWVVQYIVLGFSYVFIIWYAVMFLPSV